MSDARAKAPSRSPPPVRFSPRPAGLDVVSPEPSARQKESSGPAEEQIEKDSFFRELFGIEGEDTGKLHAFVCVPAAMT